MVHTTNRVRNLFLQFMYIVLIYISKGMIKKNNQCSTLIDFIDCYIVEFMKMSISLPQNFAERNTPSLVKRELNHLFYLMSNLPK